MAIRVYHESSVGQPTVTALQCNSSKTPSTTKANIQTKAMSYQCPYSMGIISLNHRNYKFRMRVELMAMPVLSGEFLRGVGVAVFALMRTSVVLPDVLCLVSKHISLYRRTIVSTNWSFQLFLCGQMLSYGCKVNKHHPPVFNVKVGQ